MKTKKITKRIKLSTRMERINRLAEILFKRVFSPEMFPVCPEVTVGFCEQFGANVKLAYTVGKESESKYFVNKLLPARKDGKQRPFLTFCHYRKSDEKTISKTSDLTKALKDLEKDILMALTYLA